MWLLDGLAGRALTDCAGSVMVALSLRSRQLLRPPLCVGGIQAWVSHAVAWLEGMRGRHVLFCRRDGFISEYG